MKTARTCSATNCNARCHHGCNGLTNNQTCHVKSCGCNITWKCQQHGSGMAEVIIPPPPVYEPPNCPSAEDKLCSVWKSPICSCSANLAYHCVDPSCDDVYPLTATCSSFVNLRGSTTAYILSTLHQQQVSIHLLNLSLFLLVPLHRN